jgi:transposase-like protein
MLDVQKLKGKIVEKGKSVESVSAELGINPATFYRKLKNNSFEINEADKLVDILSLTNDEAIAIFFSNAVAEMRQAAN